MREFRARWGDWDFLAAIVDKPGVDRAYLDWWVDLCRLAASPAAAAHYQRMGYETDISDVLPAVHLPALVTYGEVGDGAWLLGQQLANATLVRSTDAWSWEQPELLPALKQFLVDHRRGDVPDSVLTTLLFTDIVGSTARTASVGDRAWRDLLSEHQRAARAQISRYRGRELDTAGDGFFIAFDGPARAIRCAQRIVKNAASSGLQIRAGVHTGGCEVLGEKLAGIAVSAGARIAAAAGGGEILVSSTVKDLVAGSGISFETLGARELKGLGEWPLYAVSPSDEDTPA